MFDSLGKQIAERCANFTGVQNKICKAGIAYDSFDGGLPCLANFGRGPKQPCAACHFPTPEEVAQAVAASEAAYARTALALDAVHKDAKAKGFRKGRGGSGSLPCPVCTTGTLGYSVAGYNGHIHGRCGTEGCVWWMQ